MIKVRTLSFVCLTVPALADDPPLPAPHVPSAVAWSFAGQIDVEAERPDLHAPIGVLGANSLPEGQWQFTYRSFRTDHNGLLDGRGELSKKDVFDRGYSRTPTKLVRESHLFSALYGYSDDLTVLITIPWVSNDMRFETDTGLLLSERTIGMSDLELTGLYTLIDEEETQFHLNLGLTLPTGSHDERDELPGSGGNNVKLPYPMQLGSGTVDLVPGATWVHWDEGTSWGASLLQTVRFDKNSDGYGLGNETHLTGWVARRFQDDLSGSLRMAYENVGSIRGQDPMLDPTVGPSQDPHAQGGERLNLYFGLNYTRPGGHRFAGEVGGPLFQHLDGPQLETDVVYMVGWQYSF